MDITYILLVWLAKGRKIQVGKLGKFSFRKGYYLYVGSAKRNLGKRIERHLMREKRLFWHIDYLLQYGEIKEVWTGSIEEETISKILETKLDIPVLGFGSSDTKDNKSHLFCGEIDKNLLINLGFRSIENVKGGKNVR